MDDINRFLFATDLKQKQCLVYMITVRSCRQKWSNFPIFCKLVPVFCSAHHCRQYRQAYSEASLSRHQWIHTCLYKWCIASIYALYVFIISCQVFTRAEVYIILYFALKTQIECGGDKAHFVVVNLAVNDCVAYLYVQGYTPTLCIYMYITLCCVWSVCSQTAIDSKMCHCRRPHNDKLKHRDGSDVCLCARRCSIEATARRWLIIMGRCGCERVPWGMAAQDFITSAHALCSSSVDTTWWKVYDWIKFVANVKSAVHMDLRRSNWPRIDHLTNLLRASVVTYFSQ